jgi:xanthine dehydrogenase YagR molybdenum-binding subunit
MGLPSMAGPEFSPSVTFSYIAHFVEVRVEPKTRRIRVPASSASPIVDR